MVGIPPPVRFVAIVAVLVIVFGACGSLTLVLRWINHYSHIRRSARPTVLVGNVWHFLQETLRILTTYPQPLPMAFPSVTTSSRVWR